ncbi:MAG TPA: S8 family serine peptidase, partial [Longimicrobiales bacterium]
VAPAADLLIVKGGNGSFGFDQIVDGLIWMKRFAKAAGKPLVVNLSLGGQDGPHDGSSIPERMIDDSMGVPGVIVAVAAGNEGSNGNSVTAQPPFLMHAGRVIATGETQSYTVTIPTYTPNAGRCNDVEDIQLWYSGTDNLDITVTRPDGTFATGLRSPQISGADGPGGEIYIDNGSSGLQPNGQYVAEVQFNDCGTSGATPAAGSWTIAITGRSATSGKMYHMWLAGADLGGKSGTGAAGFDNRYVVGNPGSARSVVTVGAFTTRTSWRSAGGSFHFVDSTPLGDIADFSSAGPTADGRAKPDIAAPGAAVVSSLSHNATGVAAPLITADGQHWALEGTSMATPQATGAVALLLQANPTLSADQVKAILRLSATQDGFTARTYGGGSPQDFWGAGKLNVRAALAAMNTNPSAVAGVALNLHTDSIPRNATEKLTAIAFNGIGVRLDSTVVWSSSNPAVVTVDASGLVRAVALGGAVVRAVVGSHQDSAVFQVVPPSVLAISGSSIAPSKATTSVRGTRMPLLALALKVTGVEAMKVTSLAFDVKGNDPAAKLVLLRDLNANGVYEPADPVLASIPLGLTSGSASATRATFALDSLTVTGNGTSALILAVELSGQSPNLTSFSATLVPASTHTLGARSQVTDQLSGSTAAVASSPAVTTLFGAADPPFLLSENPVRDGHVIFNFQSRPTVAAIFTLTGRRVVDLMPRLDGDGRVDWKLTNEKNDPVAPGIYLAVFQIGGQTIRQKLFIASSAPAGASPQE